MNNNLLFALDIGTRSVVGLVGENCNNTIRIAASDRQEHHTRSMLDGQIHDVPEVAAVIGKVKERLEKDCGPLKKVAVAAAGRSLITIKAKAEIETTLQSVLSLDDERTLQIAAIQDAQKQLASSGKLSDPTSYYCVGYSTVNYTLDDTIIKTLVGQRGKKAAINIIATFLPRQVIDSIQSALKAVDLELSSLTLEPIAAINVLIPPTMRHLNIALVDIGAGTSDVAITSKGSVVGYGMVPCAGDEITEALSQKYLLDFNIAEGVKRKIIASSSDITFTDILGMEQKVSVEELTASIAPQVAELGKAIAKEILTLNNEAPQAVLLVGGGSLTPTISQTIAETLGILPARVAVRKPDTIENIASIPDELKTPDAVTPLGILKIAATGTLNFINIELNEQPLRIFNLGSLTVADALLSAGIDIRSIKGRPGLGITINYNGQTIFFPGTHGQAGTILLNGSKATLENELKDGDKLSITKGLAGVIPTPVISEITDIPESYTIYINDVLCTIKTEIKINGHTIPSDTILKDRDQVSIQIPTTIKEVLAQLNYPAPNNELIYYINKEERRITVDTEIYINNIPAAYDSKINNNDRITLLDYKVPTIKDLLGLDSNYTNFSILFNGNHLELKTGHYTVTVDGNKVEPDFKPANGSVIHFDYTSRQPIISEVLLAANFNPAELPANSRVEILLNGKPTEFTASVQNGDKVDIVLHQN